MKPMKTQQKPMTSRSNVVFVVKLPKQKTRVQFENFRSCRRYCKDLRAKEIPYECRFYYNEEPETIHQREL